MRPFSSVQRALGLASIGSAAHRLTFSPGASLNFTIARSPSSLAGLSGGFQSLPRGERGSPTPPAVGWASAAKVRAARAAMARRASESERASTSLEYRMRSFVGSAVRTGYVRNPVRHGPHGGPSILAPAHRLDVAGGAGGISKVEADAFVITRAPIDAQRQHVYAAGQVH